MGDKKLNIFVSYCWENSASVDLLQADFQNFGVNLVRDREKINYKDNLMEYMTSIRSTDFALILLTDEYLKSINCMYELLELHKELEFKAKVLPILVGSVDIFSSKGRLRYIKFWGNKLSNHKKKLKSIEPQMAIGLLKETQTIERVCAAMDDVLSIFASIKLLSFSELRKDGYKPILIKLGFTDIRFMVDLLRINQLKGFEKQEILLEKHFQIFGSSTQYYSIRAGICKANTQYEKAKFYYEKALEVDTENTAAQNNLGYLLQHQFKMYDEAKECFENVIRIDPKHSIAGLNLGCLLSEHFNAHSEALCVYKTILQGEENPMAHNNIANCYRGSKSIDRDIEKVHYHFKKALEIDPGYTEAYLNYGSFLKTEIGDAANGNKYFELGKQRTKDKSAIELFDLLISK